MLANEPDIAIAKSWFLKEIANWLAGKIGKSLSICHNFPLHNQYYVTFKVTK